MTPWVRRLIAANIIVFFLQYAAPGITDPLVFVPYAILFRPWTIVTYMFLHAGLSHILFNMIGLYFFGPRVEARLGSRRFVQLYFVSGISGALLSFLFAPTSAIIGASAAVFGVMLGFAMFWPRDRIYIWGILPIEARWLVVITTALALWSGLQGSAGGVADFAHLGGYVGAWIFLRLINPARQVARFKASTVARPPAELLGNWRRVDVNRVHEVNRDELNRILDKIGRSGLASLTPEERVFLSNFVPPDDRPSVS
ncbi:MAG TPA: rhomboid family intramembrane serine protease [Gemmatimonadaceae bacterium]|nr:rhomboid family intramembrane serine protease [Gemmatimonadaceae bacterium]